MWANKKYKLIKPYKFKICRNVLKKENIIENQVLVKPKYLSICKADMRYFLGERPNKILKNKLPIVLIHEAIGKIIYSNSKKFKENNNVCIVPIISKTNDLKYNNYDYNNTNFMSSNIDGCFQDYLQLTENQIFKIPELRPELATLEMGSIVIQAISRLNDFNIKPKNNTNIAIIGTGALAFWTSLILKEIYNCNIVVIGKNNNSLYSFDFVSTELFEKHQNCIFDIVFECVGKNTDIIYNKLIELLKPKGIIVNLGISEKKLQLDIRKIMEKGICIITSHRSKHSDFLYLINLIKCSNFLQKKLKKIVSNVIEYKNINDAYSAFSLANNNQFKTIIKL